MTTTRFRRPLRAAIAATAAAVALSAVALPAHAAPGDVTVCASGCDFSTIQDAVAAVSAGAVVSVAAGTYTGSVSIAKAITLEGAGNGADPSSATILSGASGNGLTLRGTSATPVVVKNLRVTGFASGVVAGSDVELEGVVSTANSNYGLTIQNNATRIRIADSAFDANKAGVKLGSTASASDITIERSSFDDNSAQGWYSDKGSNSSSTLTGLTIVDSTFNGNGDKGFYTEKLSDAVFQNVQFNDSGNARASQGAGLDLNLKYGAYSDIELIDVQAVGSGTPATPNGSGIAISARDDAGYASNPATLSGVTIDGGTVSGAVTGIAVNFAVSGVEISGVAFSGNGVAVANGSTSTVDASRNWWGAALPDFGALVSGDVVTSPWYTDAAMTVLASGPTPAEPVVVAPATGEIEVAVPVGVEEPRLDVSALMSGGGVVEVADGMTVTTAAGASLELAPGTTLTPSASGWGTEFLLPQTTTLSALPGGGEADVIVAIQLGSATHSFTLDRAARLVLPGAAGSQVGFLAPGGSFTPITTVCAADTQAAGDAVARDCAISVGGDLVVWTKHFTVFAAYTTALAATGVEGVTWGAVGGGLLLVVGIVTMVVAIRRRAALRD